MQWHIIGTKLEHESSAFICGEIESSVEFVLHFIPKMEIRKKLTFPWNFIFIWCRSATNSCNSLQTSAQLPCYNNENTSFVWCFMPALFMHRTSVIPILCSFLDVSTKLKVLHWTRLSNNDVTHFWLGALKKEEEKTPNWKWNWQHNGGSS